MSICSFNYVQTFTHIQGRIANICLSDELNITYISNSDHIYFCFNLEHFTKERADEIINEFKNYLDFEKNEIHDNPLDYQIVCTFNNKTNEEIINVLNRCFGTIMAHVIDS